MLYRNKFKLLITLASSLKILLKSFALESVKHSTSQSKKSRQSGRHTCQFFKMVRAGPPFQSQKYLTISAYFIADSDKAIL